MAFRELENGVRVEIRYTAHGQQIENVLYATTTVAPDASNMTALGEAVATSIETDMVEVLPSDIFFVGVQITSLAGADAGGIFIPPSATINGANSTGMLPGNVSFAVHKLTAHGGRHGQGRAYQPGLSQNQVTGDTLEVGARNAIVAAWNALLAAVNAVTSPSPWALVIASVPTGALDDDPYVAYPITSFTTRDLIVDSQRRRLTGRGR